MQGSPISTIKQNLGTAIQKVYCCQEVYTVMGLSFETNLKTVNVIHDSVLFTKYIVSEENVKYLAYTTFKRMYYGRNKL